MKKSHLIMTAVIGGAFCFITAYAGGMKIFGGDSPAESIATTAVTDVGGGDNEGFVRRKYPGCRILDRDTDDGLVEIKIRHEGKEKIVLFDGGGKWLRTLWDVRRTGLPEWALSVMERIGFTFKNVDDNDNQAVETPDGLFYAIQAERNDRPDRIYIVSRRGVASQYTDDEWADGRLHGRNFRFGGYDDGEDRFDVRRKIEGDLAAAGLLEKTEEYTNNVGYSERTGVAIEPKLSMQWFLSMKELAEPATKAVMEGAIRFVPEKYRNIYRYWMENIKDWCISRQLWWGQRIPAYYLPKGGFVVAPTAEEALEKARAKSGDASLQLSDLRQDEDVLDTWFSSWLWPISVFDGIRHPHNPEIEYYYPTNDLVTAPDIIFFWVARMIMAGYEYRHEKPFSNVYFTGIVRDKIGRKMSKQLGNSPDPLDLIAQYGADGVRMAMLISSSAGNDVMFDEALCEQGRNFGNKIWNAYRLVNGWSVDAAAQQSENNRLAVAWFREALSRSLRQIDEDFRSYRISEAFKEVYRLFWDDFSGQYLEMVKPAYGEPADAVTVAATRGFFDALMRLLHPFMPFITEEIWQALAPRTEGESICVAPMPQPAEEKPGVLARFELAHEVITTVRSIRNQKNLAQKEPLVLEVIRDENYPEEYAPLMRKMANLSAIDFITEKDSAAAAFLVKTTQYFVPMAGKIDTEAEIKKLSDDLAYYEGFLASVMKKLSNERFVQSAPEKVVANERAKQADAEAKIAALKEQIAALK